MSLSLQSAGIKPSKIISLIVTHIVRYQICIIRYHDDALRTRGEITMKRDEKNLAHQSFINLKPTIFNFQSNFNDNILWLKNMKKI